MKFEDWDTTYKSVLQWIKRRTQLDLLDLYKDNKEDWIKAFGYLNDFTTELFKYRGKKDNIAIRYREFVSLCNRYLKKARQENNHPAGSVIFQIKYGLSYLFKGYERKYYFEYDQYTRPCTEKEYQKAKKYFETDQVKFEKDFKVLTYRGINACIDSTYGDAYILDDNKEVVIFQLIWDWWSPIDTYIELKRGWKTSE